MRTLLKVVSILYIIGAAFALIMGLVVCVLGATFISSMSSSYAAGGAFIGAALGVILIVACIPTLLIGIFGLKGCAGNSSLLMAGLVLTIICLVLSVVGIIISISMGTLEPGTLVSLILPILYLIGGFSTRKEIA